VEQQTRRLAHVERMPIRWGDMDAMGHVNNTVYFRFMEQARISWFAALVPEKEAWQSTGIVIANASCNYKRAITYPGVGRDEALCWRAGWLQCSHVLRIAVDDDPEPYADGAAWWYS
jgi:acyl-CoA thioester hydrolase